MSLDDIFMSDFHEDFHLSRKEFGEVLIRGCSLVEDLDGNLEGKSKTKVIDLAKIQNCNTDGRNIRARALLEGGAHHLPLLRRPGSLDFSISSTAKGFP